jgi:copper(I)-binding protein
VTRFGGAAIAVSLLAASVLAACGDEDLPAIASDDGIAVVDAWGRPTPPNADEAAFYVTIRNDDAPDTSVIAASSPACMVILPHATTFDDDVASMGAALDEQLALPNGSTITMEPNGLHLMCLGLAEPLDAGSTVPVSIEFSGRAPIEVAVTVEQR